MLATIVFVALAQDRQIVPRPSPAPLTYQTVQTGYGDQTQEDARITVHFVAKTEDGETVADTEARGMPFTFLLGQDTARGFWHVAVRGHRVGTVRTVQMSASTVGLEIDGDPMLTVTVRIARVAPLQGELR